MRHSGILSLWTVLVCAGCFDPIGVLNTYVFGPDKWDQCDVIIGGRVLENVTPADFGHGYEPFAVHPRPEHVVRGWLIHTPDQPAAGTVIVNGASIGARPCLLPLADQLLREGFNVVLYDYAGFGDSTGWKSIEQIVPDARAVLSWVRNSSEPGRQSVALFGLSLGAGPSVTLAGEFPDEVWAVVLDSPYVVPAVADAPRLGNILDIFIPTVLDAFPADLDNKANIGAVGAPVLVLHGTLDEITPIQAAHELFGSAPNGVKFVEFETRHGDAIFVESQRYRDEIISFLLEHAPANR